MRLVALTLLAAMSAGCSGFSIYREHSFDNKHDSAIIDSKQRSIVVKDRDDEDKGKPKRTVVCSEPSPDTFSAIGQALSASSVFSPMTKEVSLALSMALAESAGTIQRAKSVQLLRDGLYAACLGYANGLSVQQYDRLLLRQLTSAIVLLAIEGLTPQPIPPSITLNAGGATLKKEVPPTDPKAQSKTNPNDPSKKDPNAPGQTEGKPDSDSNPPENKPSTEKKEDARSGRLGVGNQDFYRVLIVDKPAASKESRQSSSTGEDTRKEESSSTGKNAQAETPPAPTAVQAEASSSSNGNPLALPPPTRAAVQAVQYLVSMYLHDAMAFECLDQVIAMQRDNSRAFQKDTPEDKLLDACIKIVKSVAYRGWPAEKPSQTKEEKSTTEGSRDFQRAPTEESSDSDLRLRPLPTPFQVK